MKREIPDDERPLTPARVKALVWLIAGAFGLGGWTTLLTVRLGDVEEDVKDLQNFKKETDGGFHEALQEIRKASATIDALAKEKPR